MSAWHLYVSNTTMFPVSPPLFSCLEGACPGVFFLNSSAEFETDGRVAPRSGLAAKKSIDVGAGVIDADYRGLVKVILFNFGDENFQVQVGDRIAQLILEKVSTNP